ncbi:MAG: hypothetical protein JST83_04280, partial [Bacteroidetes bacterium]|nr:hypothetical protein [Bacteroidota bacterium]
SNSVSPVVSISPGSKVIKLYWQSAVGYQYPDYEVQILRIFNKDLDPANLRTLIDWSKALTIETQTAQQDMAITINEGSGYYAWRVRPIYNYYPNGYSNPKNQGPYLFTSLSQGDAFDLSSYPYALPVYLFHFDDPDENVNWIHTRTFVEENKTTEGIQYANGLNLVKQTQTYIPSTNTTIVGQQVYDFSSRPSLSPLPYPVPNQQLTGYKRKVATDNNAVLYTEDNFDTDSKLDNPDEMSGPVGAYFNGTRSDQGYPIPRASTFTGGPNYPFTRTTFYGDGSGRQKESSGVGEAHMIGHTAGGHTRTTRTSYSTPADIELTRIFGDEAPEVESVNKIEVTDPNGVTSVTYKNKEGQVIATCLSYNSEEDLSQLSDIYPPGYTNITNAFTVTNTATINTPEGSGFTSSTRLSILESIPVQINYNIDCQAFSSCLGGGNCSYSVIFSIVDIEHPNATTRNLVSQPTPIICPQSFTSAAIFPNWGTLPSNSAFSLTGSGSSATVIFPTGNFLIEKKLVYVSGSTTPSQSTSMSNNSTLLTAYTQILNYAISQMTSASTANTLETQLANFDPCNSAYSAVNDLNNDGICDYTFPSDFDVSFTTTGNNTSLNIATSCCGTMSVPYKVSEAKKYDCSDITTLSEYAPGGKMDLSGYLDKAVAYFIDNAARQGLSLPSYITSLVNGSGPAANLMQGYGDATPNTNVNQFNYMIYLMLNDHYYTGRTIFSGGQLKTLSDDGQTIGSTPVLTAQYDCDQVWKCWMSTVNSFTNLLNKVTEQYPTGHSSSVNDGTDNQGSGGEYNSSYDNSNSNPIVKWFTSSLSGDMKTNHDHGADIKLDVFDNFMQCVGYKFAGIIVKDCSGQWAGNESTNFSNYQVSGPYPYTG